MAAPTFIDAATGATDAGGPWTYNCQVPTAVGTLFIIQVLTDGTGITGQVASCTNVENLAGVDTAVDILTDNQDVGSAAAGIQNLYICRSISTSVPVVTGSNAGTNDIYVRSYQFDNVNTGTTIADVIENSTAGGIVNGAGTSTTCADTAVTTLGSDRLACNFGAITDDASGIAVFTGMTGGTWGNFQSYESATGTDGTVFAEFAAMPSAGTINGGTATITSLPWGVIGFALIGTPGPPAADPTLFYVTA